MSDKEEPVPRATLIRPKVVISGDEPLIPADVVERLCQPGTGEKTTCRYLASRQMPHYFCAKSDPELGAFIDKRLAEGTIGSKADNCSGPPDYQPKGET